MNLHYTAAILLIAISIPAEVIDFEAFSDGTALSNQIPGLTFTNATVLTSGVSLDPFEFPAVSGSQVAFDLGGPIQVLFGPQTAVSFQAAFTYVVPVEVQAFDSADALIGSASSLFFSNLGLSGDPGSSPNEVLSVAGAGIRRIVITGAPDPGQSFTMDDVVFELEPSVAIPEPGSAALLVGGVLFLAVRKRRLRGNR